MVGHVEEAFAAFEAVIERAPANALYRLGLASLYDQYVQFRERTAPPNVRVAPFASDLTGVSPVRGPTSWRSQPEEERNMRRRDFGRMHERRRTAPAWKRAAGRCAAIGVIVATVAIGACTGSTGPDTPTAASLAYTGAPANATGDMSAAVPASIAGDWLWSHHTIFVIPSNVAADVIPPDVHEHLTGPVAEIRCNVTGAMSLTQTGSEFSGTSTQTSDCALKTGPRFAMPFVFQSPFEVSNGHITGLSFRFNVGEGCLNRGNLIVAAGVVTGWRGSGRCEIPIPVQPAVARTISWTAVRP